MIVLDRLWLGLRDVDLPPTIRDCIVADVADDMPLALRIGARIAGRARRVSAPIPGRARVSSFRELVRSRDRDAVPAPVGTDDPAVLLYTGGTTGLPKAAVLTHRNLIANACQLTAWTPDLDDGAEVMMAALPLAHGYAMTACMNVSVLRGWTQVLIPDHVTSTGCSPKSSAGA